MHTVEIRDQVICTEGWEALRGDSLDWLLDPERPNLYWRALVELVGRPPDSPAVRRARGGANAAEPVASLLAELHPDGEWATDVPTWSSYDGPGWRLIAAVQWGADPEDPRLHAASERLLETAPGEGGLERAEGGGPDPLLTARALEAMVALGWGRHSRVQEWLAWFDASFDWGDDPEVNVAIISACRDRGRPELVERAVAALGERLIASGGNNFTTFGQPNLGRTDLAEIFAALVNAGVEWQADWRPALVRLQQGQDSSGRWDRIAPSPFEAGPGIERQPSKWVTLRAVQALLTYAVEAELPRRFPYPPRPGSES
jgi:hypothetical protein